MKRSEKNWVKVLNEMNGQNSIQKKVSNVGHISQTYKLNHSIRKNALLKNLEKSKK